MLFNYACRSVEHLLARYEANANRTINGNAQDLEVPLECTKFRTCKELLHTVDRLVEGNNSEELSVTDMTQLEEELDAALMQTRSRKTQLKMEYISTLQEQERNLIKEKKEIVQEIATADQVFGAGDDEGGGRNDLSINQMDSPRHIATTDQVFGAGDDEGGGRNDLSINQMDSPRHVTLPLFRS
ncbi:hypothetical protein LXL04_011297 [Taraxacum kok-saghyz]